MALAQLVGSDWKGWAIGVLVTIGLGLTSFIGLEAGGMAKVIAAQHVILIEKVAATTVRLDEVAKQLDRITDRLDRLIERQGGARGR
jgi:hypothetical protein